MASNDDVVAALRAGRVTWREWRRQNPGHISLVDADLSSVNLADAEFLPTDYFRGSLDGSILSGAELWGAQFRGVSAREATFADANLSYALFHECDLTSADFSGAGVSAAVFDRTVLDDADFSNVRFSGTVFSGVDLRRVRGLANADHLSPSTLGIDTLKSSDGEIPDSFLRGCGLSDIEIAFAQLYRRNLTPGDITNITYRIDELRGTRPIQTSPVFISYSHEDTVFVDMLEQKLNEAGIRFWRDIHDLKPGPMETQIDRAIRTNPVVVLVLSKHSVKSDWVQWEATTARYLEKELQRDVLCPIALDDTWKSCQWRGPLRQQIERYYILDFSDPAKLNEQFEKLKAGLHLNYPR